MKPLYYCRISDLGPDDCVKVVCIACGHETLMPPTTLLHGLHLPATMLVLDLESRVRCSQCDARGKALVTVRWADVGSFFRA